MYMDVGEFDVGFLVAKDFSTGAQIAAEKIKQNHEKTVHLTPLSNVPILGDPTPDERNNYFYNSNQKPVRLRAFFIIRRRAAGTS